MLFADSCEAEAFGKKGGVEIVARPLQSRQT
jgi:hypothetical protein